MYIKTLFESESGRILGAQIVGKDGVDKRIDLLANAVRFGQTCYELQEEELSYAPPFSSAKDPVNMVGYVIENVLEGKMNPYYIEDVEHIPENAVCLDVRKKEEYDRGHIPGYQNIPEKSQLLRFLKGNLSDLPDRFKRLPGSTYPGSKRD